MPVRAFKEGQRFGKLIITSAYVKRINRRWFHDTLCDCGGTKMALGEGMKCGKVASCGCLLKETLETHKMVKTSEYWAWSSMIQRCSNKNNPAYKHYGARGITVCNEWLSFEGFIKDMGIKPYSTLTIERINNGEGYSKDNCIWADRYTQAANQRMRNDNKTGCTGVSINYSDNTYTAKIQRSGKIVSLGRFSKLEDAITARVEAEEVLAGRRNPTKKMLATLGLKKDSTTFYVSAE